MRALISERAFVDPARHGVMGTQCRQATNFFQGDLPWRVFATIAQAAADPARDVAALRSSLDELAGFDALKETLDRHFLRRSQLLRAYRIMNHARGILKTINFAHLPELRRRVRDQAGQRERFLTTLALAQGPDSAVLAELADFVRDRLTVSNDPKSVLDALDREFALVFSDLREFNADFVTLQTLEGDENACFDPEELSELRALLGQYGLEAERRLNGAPTMPRYVDERQQYWNEVAKWDAQPIRAEVAQRAVTRYGLVLRELLESNAQ